MARRNISKSREMVESLQETLVEYFRDNILDDCEYEGVTGVEMFDALVGTFRELESDLQDQLKPIQYVLDKLDPENDLVTTA
jgi:hypothetical protein